jgi:Fe2+ or Zn2+ uptake regulation protein
MTIRERTKKYIERRGGWIHKEDIVKAAQANKVAMADTIGRTLRQLHEDGEIQGKATGRKKSMMYAALDVKKKKIVPQYLDNGMVRLVEVDG